MFQIDLHVFLNKPNRESIRYLGSRICDDCRHFNNIEELKKAIKDTWAKIERQTIKNLVSSLPTRATFVIKCDEKPIQY